MDTFKILHKNENPNPEKASKKTINVSFCSNILQIFHKKLFKICIVRNSICNLASMVWRGFRKDEEN